MEQFIPLLVNAIVLAIALLFPLWKIFGKAGLAPSLSLLVIIPGIGFLIILFILAFSNWTTIEKGRV